MKRPTNLTISNNTTRSPAAFSIMTYASVLIDVVATFYKYCNGLRYGIANYQQSNVSFLLIKFNYSVSRPTFVFDTNRFRILYHAVCCSRLFVSQSGLSWQCLEGCTYIRRAHDRGSRCRQTVSM